MNKICYILLSTNSSVQILISLRNEEQRLLDFFSLPTPEAHSSSLSPDVTLYDYVTLMENDTYLW